MPQLWQALCGQRDNSTVKYELIFINSYRKIQQDATMYHNFYYSICIWSLTCFGRHRPSSGA